MRRSYKCLMLALVIGNAQAAQRELFNARETLERAKVSTYSPRAQPSVRVELETPARFRANGHGNRQIRQQFERMDCKLNEATNSMRCVPFRAEEVNRPKK
jgi:hypothetical protein